MTSKTNFEARAAAQPTELHKAFAEWLAVKTGCKIDLKTLQLATTMRHDFQRSEENQKALAARKAKAAKAKKASAAKKAAKLQEKLAEVAKPEMPEVAETVQDDEASAAKEREQEGIRNAAKVKVTIVYGSDEPQVHKAGCADLKKLTSRQGYSRETRMVASHTELTEIIYSDMIDSGESSLEDNYMAYTVKPCCPKLAS